MNNLPGGLVDPAGIGELALSSDWETALMLGDSE
uniref:Uncharacterized protein n=1 Tax=Mycobacterium riyadhense TaxID=486698 RepID=A0A653EH38_9MYCO|nr:hypothetical protein BIN_B_01659 [Mycobacterium riyadhense]